MRLLLCSETGKLIFAKELIGNDQIPPYAILSHTLGLDNEEVTFEDIINSTGEDKPSYKKIRFCGEQARQDGLLYFWIDTCYINKRNNAELSRSINSMFRWYRNATRCYVYLLDVSSSAVDSTHKCNLWLWELDSQKSRYSLGIGRSRLSILCFSGIATGLNTTSIHQMSLALLSTPTLTVIHSCGNRISGKAGGLLEAGRSKSS
jgi:hypothetical protein